MSVILIAGPTASGKSSAAIGVARQVGGVIVNADSMQVYRELDVLTSRPGRKDEALVEHRLYGYLSARQRCNTARWLADAGEVIGQIVAAGKVPVVVGGTGLYFRALERGLSPVPDIDETVRQTLRQQLQRQGPAALHAALAQVDAESARRLKENDGQRILRALEVFRSTGKPLPHFHRLAAETSVLAGCDVQRYVLMPQRELLYERINQRFDEMMDEGALDEVLALRGMGLAADLPAMKAIGVRSLGAYLDGEISLTEAIDKAKQETRNYAKRQMTWQRNQMQDWVFVETKNDISL